MFAFVGPPIAGRDPVPFLDRNSVSAHAMLVRREVILPQHFSGRFDFDHLIAVSAASAGGIVHVPEAVTYHRIHGANQVHQSLGNWQRHRQTKDRARIRARKLAGLSELTGALLGHPRAPRATLDAFTRLHEIANATLRNTAWVRKPVDLGEVEALLRRVSSDQDAIRSVKRRYAKLARGSMHPSNWLPRLG